MAELPFAGLNICLVHNANELQPEYLYSLYLSFVEGHEGVRLAKPTCRAMELFKAFVDPELVAGMPTMAFPLSRNNALASQRVCPTLCSLVVDDGFKMWGQACTSVFA